LYVTVSLDTGGKSIRPCFDRLNTRLDQRHAFPNKNKSNSVYKVAEENERKDDSTVMTNRMDTDEELVAKAKNGDRNAFGELVSRHSQGVVNVVYRLCGDSQLAEDAAQEAFIQAWLKLSTYRPHSSLRNWLYRIAVNISIDALRKEKHLASDELLEQMAAPGPAPEAMLASRERAIWVQKAILSLPPVSRAVLVLREYEGLSYQEIASTLNIPIGTVMSRLNYARTQLKETLKPQIANHVEVEHV
jgi:RNA polymerase sigma-70 factor (ECF subfamily)